MSHAMLSRTNADEDLQQRIISFLAGRHMPSLRNLRVDVSRGTVTLHGEVHSYYEKQLSHHCCRRVAGVVNLVDAINVVSPQATAIA